MAYPFAFFKRHSYIIHSSPKSLHAIYSDLAQMKLKRAFFLQN